MGGGGGYTQDKILLQHFALKIQGGGDLCTRGSVFAGHYGIIKLLISLFYSGFGKITSYIIVKSLPGGCVLAYIGVRLTPPSMCK